MLDTFRAVHPEDRDVRTFHAFKGGVAGEKIDYILVPPRVRVLDAAIVRDNDGGRYPLDHRRRNTCSVVAAVGAMEYALARSQQRDVALRARALKLHWIRPNDHTRGITQQRARFRGRPRAGHEPRGRRKAELRSLLG